MKTVVLILVICAGAAFAEQQPSPSAAPARHVPQAKTHAEYNDYNAAYAINGGAAMEKAADDFAAKYPTSELRSYLYAKALHEYQSEDNPARMLSTGNKLLQIDPDNAIALVLTATVMADSLADGDKDREQKVTSIRKNASHALETVNSSFVAPANATPEQITAYKNTLQSMAHSALGIVALKSAEDSSAESELKAAAELNTSQPDPYIWYHLALAQDHLKKYDAALVSVNRAVEYSTGNRDLGDLAKGEQKRLLTLTGAQTQDKPQSPAPK
ncbi:MAG TPA: hypothetical protein VFT65_07800 [Candidatus Angelobacter sp.]|nr:hypothetical protein [Candidatus Angelobacter sp.]